MYPLAASMSPSAPPANGVPVVHVFEVPLVEVPLVVGDHVEKCSPFERRVADRIVDADPHGDARVVGLEPEADPAGGSSCTLPPGWATDADAGVVPDLPSLALPSDDEIQQLRGSAQTLVLVGDAVDCGAGGETECL